MYILLSIINKYKSSYEYLSRIREFCLILCGGHGTRLWPLSKKIYFQNNLLSSKDDKSLLDDTIERNLGISERKYFL